MTAGETTTTTTTTTIIIIKIIIIIIILIIIIIMLYYNVDKRNYMYKNVKNHWCKSRYEIHSPKYVKFREIWNSSQLKDYL